MIRIMKGGKCDLCEGSLDRGYELHEIQPNVWYLVCKPCEEVTEMNEGK